MSTDDGDDLLAIRRVLSSTQEETSMPQVDVDGLTITYDVQGEGEPLLLIPYVPALVVCRAFQLHRA